MRPGSKASISSVAPRAVARPGEPTRRAVLLGAAAAAAAFVSGSAAAAQPEGFFARRRLPIGLQLYTVAKELRADLEATLKVVASIGYRTVQLPSYFGRDPLALRQALDRADLRCTSVHIKPQPISPGRNLSGDPGEIARDADALGFSLVVMPVFWVPDLTLLQPRPGETGAQMLARAAARLTRDDWLRNTDFMNERAELLKRYGIGFAYHNHNNEFAPLTGSMSGFDILLKHSDPRLVGFEFDIGWIASAGIDPVAFVRENGRRCRSLHVKDLSAATTPNHVGRLHPVEVGDGAVDWRSLLSAAYRVGVRNFFVEQEEPFARPPLEAIARSFRYLDGLVA